MSIFEDVKASLDIKQVVEHYGYSVNRAGKFVCPFHNDTHPSASIKNNYFNCFVCGAGGDVITFVAKLFGLRNMDACKKLAEDFGLQVAIAPQDTRSRLLADRKRAERLAEQKKQDDLAELVNHTGEILGEYYRYLFQGKQLYPFGTKRHYRALQKLTEAEYYLECYEENPEEYSLQNKRQVENIERELYKWNHETE